LSLTVALCEYGRGPCFASPAMQVAWLLSSLLADLFIVTTYHQTRHCSWRPDALDIVTSLMATTRHRK